MGSLRCAVAGVGAMNKRGLFFTLSAIFVVMVFYLILFGQLTIQAQDEVLISHQQMESVNQMLVDFETVQLPVLFGVSVSQSLMPLFDHLNATDGFIRNSDFFKNMLMDVAKDGELLGAEVRSVGFVDHVRNLTSLIYQYQGVNVSARIDFPEPTLFLEGSTATIAADVVYGATHRSLGRWLDKNTRVVYTITIEDDALRDALYLVQHNFRFIKNAFWRYAIVNMTHTNPFFLSHNHTNAVALCSHITYCLNFTHWQIVGDVSGPGTCPTWSQANVSGWELITQEYLDDYHNSGVSEDVTGFFSDTPLIWGSEQVVYNVSGATNQTRPLNEEHGVLCLRRFH